MTPTLRSIIIVGAALSGHATAKALRRAGYDGAITLIGAEVERPYDRPPLSKEFLLGTATRQDLALEFDQEDLGAEWILGTSATGLDPADRSVQLAGGRRLRADALVVATGSAPRRLPGMTAGPLPDGVHTLRSIGDAEALRADLAPGARLAVIGAGFIGSEVAATARDRGVEVTVIEGAPTPLAGPLGEEVGRALAALHAANGVRLRCGIPVAGLSGGCRVDGVLLADGSRVDADVVLVAVGAAPAVDWLAGSGLHLAGGLRCDDRGATAIPGVWGVGDVTAWLDRADGAHRRVEHWTDSRDRPAMAVAAMLAGPADGGHDPIPLRPPYFWSDQYGVRIQFAGRRLAGDDVTIEAGSAAGADLLAVYRRQGTPIAVLGMNQLTAVARWRRQLHAQAIRPGPDPDPRSAPSHDLLATPVSAASSGRAIQQ